MPRVHAIRRKGRSHGWGWCDFRERERDCFISTFYRGGVFLLMGLYQKLKKKSSFGSLLVGILGQNGATKLAPTEGCRRIIAETICSSSIDDGEMCCPSFWISMIFLGTWLKILESITVQLLILIWMEYVSRSQLYHQFA